MKFHLHVGLIEADTEQALEEALAIARCRQRVLARLAPNVAVLEKGDTQLVITALQELGMHPKVIK
ncbi:MAG: hypothetical protein KF754_12905 [Planctomycetes bacterium]|nr:hypothetical protein [Planctomycetota bacterium]